MEQTVTNNKKIRGLLGNIKWNDIILCVLAFAVAKVGVQGGFYTLGISYMGSLYINKDLRRWGGVFTILSLLTLSIFNLEGIRYIFAALLIQLGRKYIQFSDEEFSDINQAGMVFGALTIVGIMQSSIKGLSVFGVAISFLEGIVGGGLVIVLGYAVRVIKVGKKRYITSKETISLTLLFALVLAGTTDIYLEVPFFNYIYLKDVLAIAVITGIAYLGGITVGVTISFAMGVILVMMEYIPVHFCLILCMGAVMGGLLNVLGKKGVVIGYGIGMMLGFIIFNEAVIDYSLLGAYVVAGLITCIVPDHYFGIAEWFGYNTEARDEQLHVQRIQRIVTDKVTHFTEAFEKLSKKLSKTYYQSGELSKKQISYIIEDTREKVCEGCAMFNFCWERDVIRTYNMAYHLIAKSEEQGFIAEGDLPNKFKEDCMYAAHFAYTLNFKIDIHKQNVMWENRIVENRMLIADQLNAVAQSLYKIIYEVDKAIYFNKEEEDDIVEALKINGIKVRDVIVVESRKNYRQIMIHIPPCKKKKHILKIVAACIEEVCKTKIVLVKHQCEQEGCHLTFELEQVFRVSAGASIRAKQQISGDVHSFMELREGRYLLALADGMGKGEKARLSSDGTIELLEEFMDAGIQKDVAVRFINSTLILSNREERFSTLDLSIIDLYTGVADFIKAGGMTSFILRDDQINTIKANTLPVGIIKDIDVKMESVQLREGDIIVMVTDGLLSTCDDVLGKENTFKHFILEAKAGDPQYIADYLMKKSCDLLGGEEQDDMSIIVAKLWKNIGRGKSDIKIG